jgi:hypothetical protein
MKFYFEGDFLSGENGKLSKVSIRPTSNSSTRREIFVLVAKELGGIESGENYDFGLVGEKKTPMIFPSKKKDERILLMGCVPQPRHRSHGYLDIEKCTAKILDESQGGGAWGSGSCFLSIIEEGQRVVSNSLIVWENKNGTLLKTKFQSLAEYELKYHEPKIELI